MSIKRLIGAALACSTILVSCYKEQQGMQLLAEGYSGGKAAVEANASYWVDGETVRINGADYRVNVTDGGASVTDVPQADTYRALYPNTLASSATLGDDNVTVTIPAVYVYRKAGGRQALDLPMAAYGTSNSRLMFKHLTAAVTVWVVNNFGIDLLVDSIVVSSDDYQLSGSRTITLGSTINVEACSTATAADKRVTVLFNGGTALKVNSGDSVAVQVPVLPVGTGNKFTISVATHNADTAVMQYTFSRKQTSGGTLARAQMGYAPARFGGVFSVSSTQKVRFSPGNLQYFCSSDSPEWRFALHQYDVAPFKGSYYANDSGQLIDLFGFCTSGVSSSLKPYATGESSGVFNLGGDDISATNYDWGWYNSISNGGKSNHIWRTMTQSEWAYLLARTDKIAMGQVSSVKGVILLPDNFQKPTDINITTGTNYSFSTNSYNSTQWAKLEVAGAVFLPLGGRRNNTKHDMSSYGYYWCSTKSSTTSSTAAAHCYQFYDSTSGLTTSSLYFGLFVRLVRDVQP